MEQEIQKTSNGETKPADDQDYKRVHDSSIDHKGNVPLRSSTGAWKASIFIISIEFSERLAYFAIAMNLVIYLTEVLHQDLKTAVKNVNYWTGATTLMPLFGAFLADAYLGRFFMILLSSIIYLLGLSLLTMSELIPSIKPCNIDNCGHPRKVHEMAFFIALYSLSLGTGGFKPSLESFGADQFDDNHLEERKQKMSFFNWWNFVLCSGVLLSLTVIVYVQDHVGWGVASLVLTLSMAIGFIVFYLGKPFYRYRVPEGSPLMPMYQVLVAAIIKRNLPHPSNPDLLYEVPRSEHIKGRLLCHTSSLRFLDKAAIFEDNDMQLQQRKHNPWRLVTVTMVEETKLIMNMFPIWFTSLIFGVCNSPAVTLFVKQSSAMDRKIGSKFEIPPATVGFLGALTMLLTITSYEKILVPVLRRARGNERGIKILQRIGVGMVFPVLGMAIAALVESRRLRMAETEAVLQGKAGESAPMSVFWLAPQIMILASGDAFSLVGLQEYFYEQVPDSMRSLGLAFFLSAMGVSQFISSFLITIVAHVTQKSGVSWLSKDLNSSRLDKFYWLLTAMAGLNLCLYIFFARRHSYKIIKGNVTVADCQGGDGTVSVA
ncbi:unnamed protein product [Coffea canephora]|uniref:Major facilitator superfamily (MFS) profile domain-containing protein n=1 Tax=Coffea canephora TaxID=49390 RepID=A0A068TVU6_COFCA|nr:unnamed protein product [Coffea canephora]